MTRLARSISPARAGRVMMAVSAFLPAGAEAQQRSGDNVVTAAADAFGLSIGRESLGIYDANDARGFSPTEAGNLRIEGLYFDQVFALPATLIDSTTIKVGLSAQGYAFAAPSGIVDYKLRRPGEEAGASIVSNVDSFGTYGIEADGSAPLTKDLSLAYGLSASSSQFADGTSNRTHSGSLVLSWRPAAGLEILPFWSIDNDADDEASTVYLPAGAFLPKLPEERRYEGPGWADLRYQAIDEGVLASATITSNWIVRVGAFRSVMDLRQSFSNLLVDEQPDGSGDRILYADPPAKSASDSGELRLTHAIADGPRLHVFNLSLRERDARHEFGGSELIDFGPGVVGVKVDEPLPRFDFSETSRDHATQTSVGLSYNGRWKDVGEIGLGISKAEFRKETDIPGLPVATTRSEPILYNLSAAANLTRNAILYASFSRGLEESGTAPPNAVNRNQPLAAILTEQKDAGVRLSLTNGINALVGLFDLKRPYFGFDGENVFRQVGTVESRGAEFSVSGKLTPRLDLVAGGMFLKPRVTALSEASGAIGSRPVGLPEHLLILDLNWKACFAKGLALDLAITHRGRTPATTDNLVFVPARAQVDVGSHYRLRIGKHQATLRLQVKNLFDNRGYDVVDSGVYKSNPGRYAQAFLTVDL